MRREENTSMKYSILSRIFVFFFRFKVLHYLYIYLEKCVWNTPAMRVHFEFNIMYFWNSKQSFFYSAYTYICGSTVTYFLYMFDANRKENLYILLFVYSSEIFAQV